MSGAGEDFRGLVAEALGARERAIAPYSKFRVGAALETEDGRVFTGCNIENASYGLTMCAERVALWKALSEGARSFRRLVIAAETDPVTPPCGACRQVLWEFGGDIEIILVNPSGSAQSFQLSELFPRPFDGKYLQK